MMINRTSIIFGIMALLIIFVGMIQSWNLAFTIVNLCLISSIMTLGVNIQWGYAGLVNFGMMGFTALGGIAGVLVAMPPVPGLGSRRLKRDVRSAWWDLALSLPQSLHGRKPHIKDACNIGCWQPFYSLAFSLSVTLLILLLKPLSLMKLQNLAILAGLDCRLFFLDCWRPLSGWRCLSYWQDFSWLAV